MKLYLKVGQILDAIEAAGRENETVVMLSADHGGLYYRHGRWADSDLIIPLMIKGIRLQTIAALCKVI